MSSRVRNTVVFTGRVQGVGFRWKTHRIAAQFAVTGWVRNEADGSVRLVAEGETAEVSQFIAAIREAMAENLQQVDITATPATGEFDSFEISR